MPQLERRGVTEQIIKQYQVPLESRGGEFFNREPLLLYLPTSVKIDMAIGDPASNVALITGWESPQTAVREDAFDVYSIISPLRTPYGVNLLLWNLLANPQIDTIQVAGWGINDSTDIANRPLNIIFPLFENPDLLAEDGTVNNGFKLSNVFQGNIDALKRRLGEVNIIDCREKSYSDTVAEALVAKHQFYLNVLDNRVVLGEITVEVPGTLPSEEIGLQARTYSSGQEIVDAWLKYLDFLFKYGSQVPLEHEGATVRELAFFEAVLNVASLDILELPAWLQENQELMITRESLEDYYLRLYRPEQYLHEIYPGVTKFINPEPGKYLYAELMFAYPRDRAREQLYNLVFEKGGLGLVLDTLTKLASEGHTFPIKDAELIKTKVLEDPTLDDKEKYEILLQVFDPPIDQYKILVDRLIRRPEDADKMMVLWEVPVHGTRDHKRPCFVLFNALARDGVLDATATYRSNDMGQAWIYNVYSTMRLMQDMASETGLRVGKLVMRSESAHVYDQNQELVRKIWENKVRDVKPSRKWDETQADPRSAIRIALRNEKIVVSLTDPQTGSPFDEVESNDFREIVAWLNKKEPWSQTSHALDIGIQLASAAFALRIGSMLGVEVSYAQDIPLRPTAALKSSK